MCGGLTLEVKILCGGVRQNPLWPLKTACGGMCGGMQRLQVLARMVRTRPDKNEDCAGGSTAGPHTAVWMQPPVPPTLSLAG